MQDFKLFDYIIDIDGIIKANKDGQNIDIIINGEHYDFIPEKKTEKEPEKMITLKELISVTHCDASITIDNGCDFERFTIADYETITNNYGDSIVTYINRDNAGLVIDCDMVGTDDDGIKRNLATWEPIQ